MFDEAHLTAPLPFVANGDLDDSALDGGAVAISSDPMAPVAVEEALMAEEEASDDSEDPAAGLPLLDVDERWITFVDKVARRARPLAMHLDHGSLVTVRAGEKTVVEVCFPRELHERAVAGALDDATLLDAVQIFGKGARLSVIKRPAENVPPTLAEARHRAIKAAQDALEAHAKAHPVVERAIALFGGEVRAVRRAVRAQPT